MKIDLAGRNILVTGGGGIGVGSGACKALSAAGATVIINELSLDKAQAAVEQYPGAIPVSADVSKESEVTAMFEEVERSVGTIHGVVNNAGVGLSKVSHEASQEEFQLLYDIDIKGVWLVSRALAQHLIGKGVSGSIVNISSVHAHSTISKFAIYSSSKAAVEGLTRGMAVELGPHNIRVNAIAPGLVHAEQNYDLMKTWTDDPVQWQKDFVNDYQVLNYDIHPEDCGNVVAFLMSDLSRAVTGQTIRVDGGTTSLLMGRSFS